MSSVHARLDICFSNVFQLNVVKFDEFYFFN